MAGGGRLSDTGPPGVFCLGLAVQDTIFEMPALPDGPGKLRATARREVGGGPAANAAVTVARLGAPAWFAGRLGDDATGDAIARDLTAEGVDTGAVLRFAGHRSAASVVLVDGRGERQIVTHAPPLPAGADALRLDLAGAGAVLCDCSWPEGAALLIAAAAARGIPSILDADVTRHDLSLVAGLIGAASHVVFSRPGLRQFARTDDIAAGLAAAAALRPGAAHNLLAVTDGAEGLHVWAASDPPARSLPPRVRAVDTTGAGDAFHGALALGLANGWDCARAILLAHAVAALKCSRPGGRAGLPDRAALAAFAPELAPLCAPRPEVLPHDAAHPA